MFLFACLFPHIEELRKACKNIECHKKKYENRLVDAVHSNCNPKCSFLKVFFLLIPLFRTKWRVFLRNSEDCLLSKSYQKQPSTGDRRKKCSGNVQQIYRRSPLPICDFNKVALQLYWNHTSGWVISYKFAAHSQNTFS